MTRPLVLLAFLVAPLAACNRNADCSSDAAAPQGGDPVPLITEDNLCLVADHYVAGPGAPGVILLHMNPESWDRKSWSIDFVRRIHANGWHVLNLDRRGAGNSEGNPRDAFEGDGGRKDVAAAVRFLQNQSVPSFALVSASNGTTSALDYAVWAQDNGEVEPVSIAMMSGGAYTENQHSVEEFAAVQTPTLFQADDDEGLWFDADFDTVDPGNWTYTEYPGAGHGSQMPDQTTEGAADVLDHLDENWPEL